MKSKLSNDPFPDLIISVLAVNSFKIEKAYALLENLQSQGLTEPAKLAEWEPPNIYQKLVDAGYDRGEFITYLIAERLAGMGRKIISDGISKWENTLTTKDALKIDKLLKDVRGVGPVVIQNFYLLQGIPFSSHIK